MKILFPLFFLFFWQLLPGQEAGKIGGRPEGNYVGDDSVLSEQYHIVQAFYDSVLKISNEILNGREYEYYFYPQVSSPLIPAKQHPTASIVINGKKYENITLQYDTFKDLIVYFDPNKLVKGSICPVSVNRYVIDEFNLKVSSDSLRFRYLEVPEDEHLKSGFYEIVYEGEYQFVINHMSNRYNKDGRDKYEYNTIRYIKNNAGYFKIKGKRSLLKALPGHSTEIKKYIKSSKIYVRKANKSEILSVLRYYDSLQLP